MNKAKIIFGVTIVTLITTTFAITWPAVPSGESDGGKIGSLITADTVNSRVGIGTSSPGAELHINKTGNFTSTALIETTSAVGHQAILALKTNGTQSSISTSDGNHLRFNVPGSAPAMFLNSSGLGIGTGTTTPAATLDIGGAMKLEPLSTEPVDCNSDTKYLGVLAMKDDGDNTTSLCTCSGAGGSGWTTIIGSGCW